MAQMGKLRRMVELLDDRVQIITPKFKPWLEVHGDDPMPRWVARRIAKLLSTPPRERQGTFSASSSGDCMRQQEFLYLGMPVTANQRREAKTAAIYDDGKWRHLRWQARLLAAGLLDDVEVKALWPAMHSVGSEDGEGTVYDDHPQRSWRGLTFGFELKGVSPFWYPKWVKQGQPQEHHLDQVHRYFAVTGNELFVIVYENKGTNEWHEWVIRPNKRRLKASIQELEELNAAVRDHTLHSPLPSCRIRQGPAWKDCPYAGIAGTCERVKGWPTLKRS